MRDDTIRGDIHAQLRLGQQLRAALTQKMSTEYIAGLEALAQKITPTTTAAPTPAKPE